MSIVTAITVETDRDEYSKVEPGRDVVTVSIYPTPNDATIIGEVFTIELRKARRARDVVVVDQTFTVPAGYPTDYVNGVIEVTFDLPTVVAVPEGWSLLRRGEYFINVASEDAAPAGEVTAESDDFKLSLMTVDHLREAYAFGVPMQSFETRAPKVQPQLITGVTISEVSRGHPVNFLPMSYNVSSGGNTRTISWSGGPSIPVSGDRRQTLMLPGSQGSEYLMVDVNPILLPTSNQGELIYIEQEEINEETFRKWIDNAIDLIENTWLQTYIEPTSIVTDTDPTAISFAAGAGLSPVVLNADYDFVKSPVTFYASKAGQWVPIQFPFFNVLRMDSLFGAVANTRIVDINLEWVEISESTGFVELVPFNQEIAFDFIGVTWVESLRGGMPLPNFWHYALVTGLREVPGEILDLIGWQSSITAMTVAGHAYRGGFSSQSVSRDGVSQSVSYTASAIYGTYSATIEDYRKNIKATLEKIKQRYTGLRLMVVG